MNVLSRGLLSASDWLVRPTSKHERRLVRAWDAQALIVTQSYIVILGLLSTVCVWLMAPALVLHALSVFCSASLVLFYTCVGAKWVFRYKGAQQVKLIHASFWRFQVFKFVVVVTFSVWVCVSPWMEPVSALAALALMQCTPLCAGVFFPAHTMT